jgi:hypothetical protein
MSDLEDHRASSMPEAKKTCSTTARARVETDQI